jgi:hypothetical protein
MYESTVLQRAIDKAKYEQVRNLDIVNKGFTTYSNGSKTDGAVLGRTACCRLTVAIQFLQPLVGLNADRYSC